MVKRLHWHRYQPAAQELWEQGVPNYEDDPVYHEAFWKEQIRRCIIGYSPKNGDYITGAFYFYLNFCKVKKYDPFYKDRSEGAPYYCDVDHERFQYLHETERMGKGYIEIKARQRHYSTNTAAYVLHRWLFYPATEIGVGAFDEKHVDDSRRRIDNMHENLPPELRQKAEPKTTEIWEAQHKTLTDSGWVYEGGHGRIHFRGFGNKQGGAGAFRGLSLKLHLFEEAGENPLLLKCLLSSEECWKVGSEYYGMPIVGGTVNKLNIDSNDFEELWYEHEKYNLRQFFVSAAKHYYPFYDPVTGVSDMEKAKKVIEAEHEEKRKLDNKTAYYSILQEKPLEPAHAFMGDTSSMKMPLDEINRRITVLTENDKFKNRLKYGRLYWEKGRYNPENPKVEFELADEGDYMFTFIERPRPDYKYLDVGGVDTYFYNSAPNSDSMGSLFIYRRWLAQEQTDSLSEAFICEYTKRETTTEEFYDNCLKLAVYYNIKLLVEYDENFFKYFEKARALRYMKERPLTADSPNSNVFNKYMIHMKVHQKTLGTNLLSDYFKTHIDNVFFLKLLQEAKVFGKKNTDRIMAAMIAMIHDADNTALNQMVISVKDEGKSNQDYLPFYSADSKGNIMPTWWKGGSREKEHKPFDITQQF